MKTTVKLILYYFAYQLAILFILMACYAGWVFIEKGNFDFSLGMPITLSLIANTLVILLMTWQLIHYKYIPINRQSLNTGNTKTALICIIIGISAIFWMNYLSDIVRLPDWFKNTFTEMQDNPLGIINICILAPIFEELFFRGAIEGSILRSYRNPAVGIIVSALIFGLIHANPAQVVFAFLFGIILGFIYYRTKSITLPIILHFINNTVSVILSIMYPEYETLTDILGKSTMTILAIISLFVFIIAIRFFIKDTKISKWYIKE